MQVQQREKKIVVAYEEMTYREREGNESVMIGMCKSKPKPGSVIRE